MSTEIKQMSAFDVFAMGQETLDDAKKKSSEESRKSTKYLRITQDGTVAVRVLPLAPVVDAEGNVTMPRKGYEYPTKELVLKIKGVDNKGKEKSTFVNVTNAKYRFPELKNDPVDLYVQLVCEKYADDEALCKKVKGTSFNGGLKYDSKRCMYVFDIDKRGDGLQILQLSFSQYKELEERKLNLWEKLIKKNPKALCPISSIEGAYPLEITRSTENKKTNYSFNIDTLSEDSLTEDELNALLNAPRIPEAIYKYSRFHLEATIAYLKQYDETADLNIMETEEMKECIDQIKMLLPADDQSHFSVSGKEGDGAGSDANNTIDGLWATFESLEAEGLDDKSEEGQELRASIMEFIDANGLDIHVSRRDSNYDLLLLVEEEMKAGDSEGKAEGDEDKEARKPAAKVEDPEDDDDEPAAPGSTRNDDTNEPAVRSERRAARPVRRRQ